MGFHAVLRTGLVAAALLACASAMSETVVRGAKSGDEAAFVERLAKWLVGQSYPREAGAIAAPSPEVVFPADAVFARDGTPFLLFPSAAAAGHASVEVSFAGGVFEGAIAPILAVDESAGFALAAWPAMAAPPRRLPSGEGLTSSRAVRSFVSGYEAKDKIPRSESLAKTVDALLSGLRSGDDALPSLAGALSDGFARRTGVSALDQVWPHIDDVAKARILAAFAAGNPIAGARFAIAELLAMNYGRESAGTIARGMTDGDTGIVALSVMGDPIESSWVYERGGWTLERLPLKKAVQAGAMSTPSEIVADVDFSPPYHVAWCGFATIGTDPLLPLTLGGFLELPSGGNLAMRILGGGAVHESSGGTNGEFVPYAGYHIDFRVPLSWGEFSLLPYATGGVSASVSLSSGRLIPLLKYGGGIRLKLGRSSPFLFGAEATAANGIVTEGSAPSLWAFAVYAGFPER